MFSALAIADSSVFLTVPAIRLRREFEVGERRRHLLAADQRGNEVQLLRADTDRAQHGARLVVSKPARSFGLAHGYFLFAFLSAP